MTINIFYHLFYLNFIIIKIYSCIYQYHIFVV